MNRKDRRNFRNRKRRIENRLSKESFPEEYGRVMSSSNLKYEIAERSTATGAGGLGAIHRMVRRLGLDDAITRHLRLLKIYLPYSEADHVLNIAYNILSGGQCLEDLEQRRQDEAYMKMLGACRIPDPTTAGDFLRRFRPADVTRLMEAVNTIRERVWAKQPPSFRQKAVIDVDGTMVGTAGEKKRGMDLSYDGTWGYNALLVSLAKTQEPLYLVNRSGNEPSHSEAVRWMDKAIALCRPHFKEILLRGDTAFSLTTEFDHWTAQNVKFVFGYDAVKVLINKAERLSRKAWTPFLAQTPSMDTESAREKRENVKDQKVIERNLRTIRRVSEHVAEFQYKPTKCKRSYRMIVLKKDLAVERGEPLLIPNEVRYFFYVTNDESLSAEEVIFQAHKRCDQENLIEQLKNGVHALRSPVHDLTSNWAHMVIASLAWTLKAWFGLTQPKHRDRADVIGMEFKRFLQNVMLIPCQVVEGGRRIRLRLLAYNERIRLLFASVRTMGRLRWT